MRNERTEISPRLSVTSSRNEVKPESSIPVVEEEKVVSRDYKQRKDFLSRMRQTHRRSAQEQTGCSVLEEKSVPTLFVTQKSALSRLRGLHSKRDVALEDPKTTGRVNDFEDQNAQVANDRYDEYDDQDFENGLFMQDTEELLQSGETNTEFAQVENTFTEQGKEPSRRIRGRKASSSSQVRPLVKRISVLCRTSSSGRRTLLTYRAPSALMKGAALLSAGRRWPRAYLGCAARCRTAIGSCSPKHANNINHISCLHFHDARSRTLALPSGRRLQHPQHSRSDEGKQELAQSARAHRGAGSSCPRRSATGSASRRSTTPTRRRRTSCGGPAPSSRRVPARWRRFRNISV